MLVVYAKEEHCKFIRDVEAESAGTGIMGIMVSEESGTYYCFSSIAFHETYRDQVSIIVIALLQPVAAGNN